MRYPIPKRYRQYIFHPFKKNGSLTAVNNINLSISKGDCLGLLGSNGAGKTTLLKSIGGLLYPSEGSVSVNGYDTIRHNSEVRKNVGFVLNEDRSFYWRLTGIQNLEFFGTLDNLSGRHLGNRIKELLELVGLEFAVNKRVSDYSSGMRQRLAIARGLLADPEILILDEPTKTLDPLGAEHLRDLISKSIHSEKNKTLILATHKIEEAEMLCNKICIMKDGHIVALASMDEISCTSEGLSGYYKKVLNDSEVQC